MKEKKITRQLWHQFTDAEERNCGQVLTDAIGRHQAARDRKRDVNKMLNEEIADIESEISILAVKLRAHGETQPVDCVVVFHKPTAAAKEIFRCDTGEKIAEEAMTPEECQEHLFDAGEEKPFQLEQETGSEKAEGASA
ncbi:MAG TPA: hypothetical protein VKQ28_00680 [Candidatus Acidoferrum sp.]|nr:hypothetical protein [Candidatus Acidoferrum sp.]